MRCMPEAFFTPTAKDGLPANNKMADPNHDDERKEPIEEVLMDYWKLGHPECYEVYDLSPDPRQVWRQQVSH